MKFSKLFYSLALCVFCSTSVNAAVTAKSLGKDERVQFFDYEENEVFEINTGIGNSLLIQLDKNERVLGESSGIMMGDGEAWKIDVRGSNIFLKPKAKNPESNLVIVTNKRTYALFLRTNPAYPKSSIVKFIYDDADSPNSKSARKASYKLQKMFEQALVTTEGDIQAARNMVDTKIININFMVKGDETIQPSAIWSDNLFTFLRFDNSTKMPVPFSVDSDGNENMVNTHVDGDTLVIHGREMLYMLRLGNKALQVFNAEHKDGSNNPDRKLHNKKGTSKLDEVRIETGEAE